MSKQGSKWKESKWVHLRNAVESMEVNDVLQWIFDSKDKPTTIRTIVYRVKVASKFTLRTIIGVDNRIFIIRLA